MFCSLCCQNEILCAVINSEILCSHICDISRMYTIPGLGTYHFSPILLPTRTLGTIRHLENGGNQNFAEALVTLIVTM